jgi:hypothetical protein
MIIHPAKFCKVPDKLIPMATQAAVNNAKNDVVCTQSIQAALKKTAIFSNIEIRLIEKVLIIGSIFVFLK